MDETGGRREWIGGGKMMDKKAGVGEIRSEGELDVSGESR